MKKIRNEIKILLKASAVITVALAFVLPGSTVIANMIPKEDLQMPKAYLDDVDFVPGEILVKFKLGIDVSTPSKALREVEKITETDSTFTTVLSAEPVFKMRPKNTELAREIGLNRWAKIEVSYETDILSEIEKYNAVDVIEYADPNHIYHTFGIYNRYPNDPRFSDQWNLDQNNDCDIDAPEAWDIETGDSGVVIAVIDTGVDYNHQDLSANIAADHMYDFVDINPDYYEYMGYTLVPGEDYEDIDSDPMDVNGHGTHCAGIAAAVTDNGVGIAGVCWNCKIMPLRAGFSIIDPDGYEVGLLDENAIVAAIRYAADNGADVISMSFGGAYSQLAANACYYAYIQHVVLVAAAGNENTDDWTDSYPAAYAHVMAVAATDHNDYRASFSNYGYWIDVAAPGNNIWSTIPNNGYEAWSGTSMACPHVAGLAALLISRDPYTYEDNPDAVESRIKSTTDWIGDPSIGTGRINAFNALDDEMYDLEVDIWQDVYHGTPDQAIEFIGSVYDGIPTYTYRWDWENDGFDPEIDYEYRSDGGVSFASHSYETGNHIVRLTVEDSIGNIGSDTAQVHISSGYPELSVWLTPGFGGQPGWYTIHFFVFNTGRPPINFNIAIGTDTFEQQSQNWNGEDIDYYFEEEGLYPISVTATDSDGKWGRATSYAYIRYHVLEAYILGEPERNVPPDQPVIFEGYAVHGLEPYMVKWRWGDGTPDTPPGDEWDGPYYHGEHFSASHSFPSGDDDYIVELIVWDIPRAWAWKREQVLVHVIDEPPSFEDNSPESGTTGDLYTFNVLAYDDCGVESVSVTWSHGSRGGTDVPLNYISGNTWSLAIRLDHSIEDLTYQITVIDNAGQPCVGDEQTRPIFDNDAPEHEWEIMPVDTFLGDDYERFATVRLEIWDNIDDLDNIEGVISFQSSLEGNATSVLMERYNNGYNNGFYYTFDIPDYFPEFGVITYHCRFTDQSGNYVETEQVGLRVYPPPRVVNQLTGEEYTLENCVMSPIGDAVYEAQPYDTLLVYPSIYRLWWSSVSICDQGLHVKGVRSGRYKPIIDASDTNVGIEVRASCVEVSNLTIRNGNQYGIRISGGVQWSVTIQRNTIINNGIGIWGEDTRFTTIFYNTIRDSSEYGIKLEDCRFSHIYRNNFIDNNGDGKDAYDDFDYNHQYKNLWDNDNNGRGNYWSDYLLHYPNGYDSNGDGVYDSNNYWLDSDEPPPPWDPIPRDRYPLVNPVLIPEPIPDPLPTPYVVNPTNPNVDSLPAPHDE